PHDDGPHTYLSVKCPLMDSTGKPYAVFGISTDITERAEAKRKLEMQLGRLDLLSRTTRAIAERQDLTSIFQIVLQSLEEHFPVDFACLCLCDQNKGALIVESLGRKSMGLAPELATPTHSTIQVEQDGLSRCIQV